MNIEALNQLKRVVENAPQELWICLTSCGRAAQHTVPLAGRLLIHGFRRTRQSVIYLRYRTLMAMFI